MSSTPAIAPVCDDAARLPASVRPNFNTTIGFSRSSASRATAYSFRAPLQGCRPTPAAVADDTDIAGGAAGAADCAGGGHREVIDEIDYAVAIRPHDAHARRARKFNQARLPLAAFRRGGF